MSLLDGVRNRSEIVPYRVEEHVRLTVEERDALVELADAIIQQEALWDAGHPSMDSVRRTRDALERLRR